MAKFQTSKSHRDLSWLINSFEGLGNDDEMVEFIDCLSMAEAASLDRAMDAGLCAKEPEYLADKSN